MKPEAKKVTANHFVRSLCEFEPILLTKDILAKAGYFCQRNDGDSWYISFSGSKRHIGTVKVKYLHELQQFRRLCGKEEISIEL